MAGSSLIRNKGKLAKMTTRCHLLLFIVLSLVIIYCHSLSFLVTRCHLLSIVVSRCTTRCRSFSFVGTRFHSLSLVLPLVVPLVVIRCHSLYNSLPLDVSLVCLFINDVCLIILSHENCELKYLRITFHCFFTAF